MNSRGSSLYLNACPWFYWFIGELGDTLYSCAYVQGSGFRPSILIHIYFRVQGLYLVFLYICSGFRVQTLYSYTYVQGSGFRPCILIHMFRYQGSDLVFLLICSYKVFRYAQCKLSSVQFLCLLSKCI